MKKFLLGLVLLLATTCPLFGQGTSGWHRINQVIARGSSGVQAVVVPYAKVTVTDATTGLAAVIYSDPGLSSQITPPVVTADNSGNYGYYLPLNYCVNETVSSPGQGTYTSANVCGNTAPSGTINYGTAGQLGYYAANGTTISGENFATVTQGGTGAQTAQGAATNIVTNNTISPAKIGNAYFYCDQAQFTGSDFGQKMASCFAALYAAGGGTADSTNFYCPTTGTCLIGTATLQCGDNIHHVTWKTPFGYITRGTVAGKSTQILRNSYCNMQAPGSKGSTIIDGPADGVAVQQGQTSGGVRNADWVGINVQSTGAVTPGSVAFQFSGVTPGYPFNNSPGTATPGAIGSDPVYQSGAYFPGYIAQHAVYNYALTAAQVANHYTVGSSGTGYEGTVIADSPISYYPLKETSGTVATDLTGSRNGTYTGGVTVNSAAGIPGDTSCGGVCNAPLFNGTSGYVSLPTYTWIPSGDWSVEGWYNTNTTAGVGFKRMWGFSSSPSDATWFTDDGSTGGTLALIASYSIRVDVTPDLTENAWVHVVVVKASGILTIYRNGVASKSGTDTLDSVIQNSSFGGADIGLLFNSIGGCTCYNKLSNVDASGASFGARTMNSSGYPAGVNSDQWTGGRLNGPIGLWDNGSEDFSYSFLDEENNSSPNGAVLFANPAVFNAGTGYAIGDTGHITGGSGTAVYQVTSINGSGSVGSVKGVAVVPTVGNAVPSGSGTGYSNAPSVATTATTGSGTGLQLDIVTGAYSVFTGSAAYATNFYQEAGGGTYECGQGNQLNGFWSSWLDWYYDGTVGAPASLHCWGWGDPVYSNMFQSFNWGPTPPNSVGVTPRYNGPAGWIPGYIAYDGATFNGQFDAYLAYAYHGGSSLTPTNLWSDGPACAGANPFTNNHCDYTFGHSTDWNVGRSRPRGGTIATGRTTYGSLGTPAAPTVVPASGSGTNWSYAIVAVDQNGGVTLPSSFTTVSGPATLSSSAGNTITYPWVDGAACMGVLKTNTSTSPLSGGYPQCNNAGGGNAFSGTTVNGGTISVNPTTNVATVTFLDYGQATSGTSLPGRDTTADFCFGSYCLNYGNQGLFWATPASGGAGLAQLRAIQTADLPSALTPASVAVGAATSTLYRCVGGTDDGFLVWKTSVCTGAGGTTTSTAITTP